MKDGGDRLVECAFQSWIGHRLHGLSEVGNVQGVVLKFEWNPLHPRTPPVESTEPSQALSTPSPSCPFSCGGSPILVQPHHHLLLLLSLYGSAGALHMLLFGLCGSFFLGSGHACFVCFSFVCWVSCKL